MSREPSDFSTMTSNLGINGFYLFQQNFCQGSSIQEDVPLRFMALSGDGTVPVPIWFQVMCGWNTFDLLQKTRNIPQPPLFHPLWHLLKHLVVAGVGDITVDVLGNPSGSG